MTPAQIATAPLADVLTAARERAARERRDYSETVAALLERLCDEVERAARHDRAALRVRLDEAAKMRRGQAL